MSGIVQEYFATLSDRILTTALQDTLVCSQDDNSTSSQPSAKQQVTSTAYFPIMPMLPRVVNQDSSLANQLHVHVHVIACHVFRSGRKRRKNSEAETGN